MIFSCLVDIWYTNPVCPIDNCIRNLYAWFFANSHNLSLFSVGIPSNLRHNLLPCCSRSSVSCWFCKFCFLISNIWFWSMILSDSSSFILLLCFFSSFVKCNSIYFRNFSNRFPHNSSTFLFRLQNCSLI